MSPTKSSSPGGEETTDVSSRSARRCSASRARSGAGRSVSVRTQSLKQSIDENRLSLQDLPTRVSATEPSRAVDFRKGPTASGARRPFHLEGNLTSSGRPSRRALQGGGDPFGVVSMTIHRNLKRAFQLLMRLRRRRGLGIGARGTRPGRVRAADRLDENVASRHAAILDDVLDREFGVASGVKFSDDRALQGRSLRVCCGKSTVRQPVGFLPSGTPEDCRWAQGTTEPLLRSRRAHAARREPGLP
jgi:hypothetical protein